MLAHILMSIKAQNIVNIVSFLSCSTHKNCLLLEITKCCFYKSCKQTTAQKKREANCLEHRNPVSNRSWIMTETVVTTSIWTAFLFWKATIALQHIAQVLCLSMRKLTTVHILSQLYILPSYHLASYTSH